MEGAFLFNLSLMNIFAYNHSFSPLVLSYSFPKSSVCNLILWDLRSWGQSHHGNVMTLPFLEVPGHCKQLTWCSFMAEQEQEQERQINCATRFISHGFLCEQEEVKELLPILSMYFTFVFWSVIMKSLFEVLFKHSASQGTKALIFFQSSLGKKKSKNTTTIQ